MINATAKSIRVLGALSGEVRIRLKTPNLATVELLGNACRLVLPPSPNAMPKNEKTKGKV